MYINLGKLDIDVDPVPDWYPDPHSEKLLDPDTHKMNAYPQLCVDAKILF